MPERCPALAHDAHPAAPAWRGGLLIRGTGAAARAAVSAADTAAGTGGEVALGVRGGRGAGAGCGDGVTAEVVDDDRRPVPYPGGMRVRPTLNWTPAEDLPPPTTDWEPVADALSTGGVLVLSGAGISTESGIPDYRGEGGSLSRHTPMTYQDFTASAAARRRYWARSHLGRRVFGRARPNAGHRAVAAFGRHGLLSGVITQNVDGLHQAAGSQDVVELHGSLDRVVCLSCGALSPRSELARRLEEANADFEPVAAALNPDGDADLTDEQVGDFRVLPCTVCDGILKPDVVFFGETVPPQRVEHCRALVREAASLLILGSSLTVMSGFRFVRQAGQAGKPVLIVNRDPTRGDRYALTRVALPLGATLATVAARLGIAADGDAAAW